MTERQTAPSALSRYADAHAGPVLSARWRAVRLNRPSPLWGANGVSFGPDGRLYVAQFLAGQISAVDTATGDVEVVVPLDSPVQAPDDLAFGTDGSMYIADITPNRVWRRSPQGEYTLVSEAVTLPNGITCVGDRLFVNEMCPGGRVVELFPDGGEPVELAGGLALGNAMQLGPDGWLYYPHMLTDEVWRVPPDGGAAELVAERVPEPVAVRFDRAGVLLVLSRGTAGAVTRIDLATGGRTTLVTGVPGLDNAAFDQENRMLVSSFASGGITEVDHEVRTRPIVARGLSGPYGVAADARGRVYAADHFRLASDTGADGIGAGGTLMTELAGFAHGLAADGAWLHLTSQHGDVRSHHPDEGTTRVRATGLDQPSGVAAAGDGAVVVAETGAGRVLRIGADDAVTVLGEGLAHPVDVAVDDDRRVYVSDDRLGAVLRLDGGEATVLVDGLGGPEGIAVRGAELFVVEAAHRRLRAVCLATGETRTEAEHLAVGLPPGTVRAAPDPTPAPTSRPRAFAGLAVAPDGSLLLAANGEGTVLRLAPPGDGAA